MDPDDLSDLADDEDDYDAGWDAEDCGLMDDGQCQLAGTEHCDFSCPYRDSEHFAGSTAWVEKHKGR